MKTTHIKSLVLFFLCIFSVTNIYAQSAQERTAPFRAVKWEGETPIILLDQWYTLTAIDGVPVTKIIAISKKKRPSSWQKYFSEDIIEAMTALETPLKTTAVLTIIQNGKTQTLSAPLTKENRKEVRAYNKEHPLASTSTNSSTATRSQESITQEQERIVADIQKNIAKKVNIKSDAVYGFKSAKIEFTTTGHKLYAGKETYYIDDYGKTVIIVTDKPGMYEPENTTMIWKDGKTTMINHHTKKYYTTPVRTKSSEPPAIAYSNETQRKQGGYTKKGNQNVAGKDCEVYEHTKMNVTYYLWKNIDVKLINYSLGGQTGYTREATSIEENITIPASLFTIPEGYKK